MKIKKWYTFEHFTSLLIKKNESNSLVNSLKEKQYEFICF